MSSVVAMTIGKHGMIWAGPVLMLAQPVAAQDDSTTSVGEVLEQARDTYGPPPPMENCSDEQEAAILSGEIIVCRRQSDQSEFRTMPSGEAQSRYARETMNKGNPQTPDVAGGGIFRGPATIGSLCIPGLAKCPPPPALIIDVTALPQAPPGSDADRVGRGLPPLGRDDATIADTARSTDPGKINPAESAERAEQP